MAPCLNHFNLLQTISFVYVSSIVIYTGLSLSLDEECSALFQFKQSINNQDDETCAASWFRKFNSWKSTSNKTDTRFDCCSWEGVLCTNNDTYSQVIGLDLSESFLCGNINSSNTLFNLVNLQTLNLAMNNFIDSEIPSEIARLKQLINLNLSDSGFTGQIPIEISQLVQLSSLDLSGNPLKLQSPGLNLVQNLTRLEELHLSGVDISSFVPNFLTNFSSLSSIRLFGCSLLGEFPIAIFDLPKLKILSLGSNTNLNGSFPEFRNNSLLEYVDVALTSFFGIVPNSISNLNKLEYLRLTGCSFSGRIPRSLSNMTQLAYLSLAVNEFTGVVPSLVSLSKLDVLQLSGNNFEKGRFPEWIGKLTELSGLYLTGTNMYGEIPPFLGNLTKLSVVAIGKNSLSGHIPSSFFNLTQLTLIDLQENQLQGPISNSFSNFKSLEDIRLKLNNFSGRVDIDMFLGLSKLNTLALGHGTISLVASNNYTNSTLAQLSRLELTSCNLKEFPTFLRFQNKLSALLLSRNLIEGLVPMWIWNNSQETLGVIDLTYNSINGFHQNPRILPWQRLEGFFMRNNQLQGQLPIPPQTTVVYDVSYNNLTQEIPQLLCGVKSLRVLDLSSNKMSGTLPPCLGNLSNSLFILNLRKNNFHGIMMNVFTNGSELKSIDLSENGFTGQLPRSLINCTDLEVLSLGDNSFNDVFPFWLGTLSKLQVLVLRSNKLYGPIENLTSSLSQFSKLRILDLSNNNFNGQLHDKYFQAWNEMKSTYNGDSSVLESWMFLDAFSSQRPYSMTLIHKGVRRQFERILDIFTAIDLSSNNFEGDIPLSLQDLRGLESLNLSNNHFTGRVDPSLGYLENLESLDLSRNNLSGEIPQQLVQLGFLAIFSVSFNNLNGRIPQGKQFNTFENSSYEGNPGLCGVPLSKECGDLNALRPLPTSDESESLFPSEIIDWVFVFCGLGSGLVIGIVLGNFLHSKYSERFTKRKEILIRRLSNTRRNRSSNFTTLSEF